MFKSFSKKIANAFAWILICLIVLSFAIWGIGDVFRGRVDNSVATVGKRKISVEEFREAVRGQYARLQQIFGKQVLPEELKAQLEQTVLRNMATSELVAQEALDLGLYISDDYIIRLLAAQPEFQDSNGKFSPEKFKSLRNEKQYLNSLKVEVASKILMDSLESVQVVPDLGAKNLLGFREEKRIIDYVAVPPDYIKQVPNPSGADLNEFYEKNKEMFAMPEKRDVSYVEIPANIGKDVKVTEEQVKAEYEMEKAAFVPEESRDIAQLLFDTEQDAKTAYETLKPLGDLKSSKKGQYSELSKVARKDLTQEFAPVFALRKGELTQPIKSSLGWHILKVSNISKTEFPSYEQLKEGIRQAMQEKTSSEYAYRLINGIEDELAGGAKLGEVANKFSFKEKKLSGITKDGKTGDDLTSSNEFIKTAFSIEQGASSGVIASKKSYFVVSVDSVTPSRIKALDEVRGVVEEKWRENKKDELVKKMAKEIYDRISGDNGKKDLAAAVNGTSLKISTSGPIPRNAAQDKALPKALIEEAFSLKPGEATAPQKADNGSYYVAQVKTVIEGGKKHDEAEVDRIKQELKGQFSQDLMEQYLSYLRTKRGVSINNALISGSGS